jgi:hypothetical protein
MKRVATHLLLCFLFLTADKIYSQDFMIIHDLVKDTSRYLKIVNKKDTQNVSGIVLKTPGRVKLRVDNFNPFYYRAEASVTAKPDQTWQIGSFISALLKLSPEAGKIGERSTLHLFDPKSLLGESKLNTALREYMVFSDMYDSLQDINSQLNMLKYDIEETEKDIKSKTRTAGNRMVMNLGLDSFNTKQIINRGKDNDYRIKLVLKNIKDADTLSDIQDLGLPNPDLTTEAQPFRNILLRSLGLYDSIMKTPYTFFYSGPLDSHVKEVKLRITPRDSSAMVNGSLTLFYPIITKGYLNITNSIGVAFSYYGNDNGPYYIKPDMTIARDKGEMYIPVVSTFINFYGARKKGIKYGGSLGIGIPAYGSSKDLNFFLGFLGLLGHNDAIFLSGGITGTRKDQLAEGWKLGQTVPNLSFQVPTFKRYKLGGYLSITFNLLQYLSFTKNKPSAE